MFYTRSVTRMGGNGRQIQTNKVKVLAEYPTYILLEIIDAIGGTYKECANKFALRDGTEILSNVRSAKRKTMKEIPMGLHGESIGLEKVI
jgi:hypothetical protein